jgi:hypothetical protein
MALAEVLIGLAGWEVAPITLLATTVKPDSINDLDSWERKWSRRWSTIS